MTATAASQVIVVGAGFGGLETARGLAGAGVRLMVIDKRNHHLFQPLLYQVATASLAPSEVAWPIRSLFRSQRNLTTVQGDVIGVDAERKRVLLADGETLAFDMLVLATGARHAYFGHDEWEPYAPGLKTLEDATVIRARILRAFERAERTSDAAERAALLTFVIIGGGPTGVELAGAVVELARETLRRDFRTIDTRQARVVLVEAGPRLLPGFREDLSDYALRALSDLGVEVRLGQAVTRCTREGVEIGDLHVPAHTAIWAAGVAASPVAVWLGAPADRAGRILVRPDLTVPGHPDIFAIGDVAHIETPEGKLVPGVATSAKQEGRFVARVIKARLRRCAANARFVYKDAGSLATIGKRAAVIDFGWIALTGRFAWWLWGLAHIYFLIGLRHRLAVALNWLWIYFTGQRSARLITHDADDAAQPRLARH